MPSTAKQQDSNPTLVFGLDIPLLILRDFSSAILKVADVGVSASSMPVATAAIILKRMTEDPEVTGGIRKTFKALLYELSSAGLSSNFTGATAQTPTTSNASVLSVFLYSLSDDRFDSFCYSPTHLARVMTQAAI